MKIIQPSAHLIPHDEIPVLEMIESCGRICYKSEDKISPGSANRFIKMARDKKHNTVLEMAARTLELTTTPQLTDNIDSFLAANVVHLKYLQISRLGASTLLVTGTVRAWREFFLTCTSHLVSRRLFDGFAISLPRILWEDIDSKHLGPTTNQIAVTAVPLEHIDGNGYMPQTQRHHRYALVKFIVSRAVSHELVRHRPVSWLQESQRYCRYGDHVQFIEPSGAFSLLAASEDDGIQDPNDIEPVMEPIVTLRDQWLYSLFVAEDAYQYSLTLGASPQQARLVLPNSCKTELYMFANLTEYMHFFRLRTSNAAEPSMREVVRPLYDEFHAAWPWLFPKSYTLL